MIFMNNFKGLGVVANIRGGGDFGQKWYKDGIKEKKQNSIDDFHAAAEFLQKNNFTTPQKTIIHGISNGGLLTTACAN